MTLKHAIRVAKVGVYSSVGHTADQTQAALRCRLNNFSESASFDRRGGAVWVAEADVPSIHRGLASRQTYMLGTAIKECLSGLSAEAVRSIPVIYCLSKSSHGAEVLAPFKSVLAAKQHVIEEGASSLGHALALAAQWLIHCPSVLIAAVDSYVTAESIEVLLRCELALTESNGSGVIPGEAACALLVTQTPTESTEAGVDCIAFSVTSDTAVPGGAEPNLGIGLAKAITLVKHSMSSGARVAIRISDQAGDEWHATQASLAAGRSKVSDAELWCPADSLGYCGAASGPLALAWAHEAMRRGYAPKGYMLCHQTSSAGQHAAMLLKT